jgi:hypothetical protein
MRKRLLVFFLLCALISICPPPANSQIANTGPAGLARQMPRIYGPYMANRSRIKYKQKQKQKQRRLHRHRTRRSVR